jgi:predicted transcriptional regulator
MPTKKDYFNITGREMDVLEALWSSEKPLVASDIPKMKPSLSISSVQLALRNLVKKKLVEVADIVYSGTVLSRSYRPLVSKKGLISRQVIDQLKSLDKTITTTNIVATLLQHEKNEKEVIEELEELLKERKKLLEEKEGKKK